MPRARLRVGEGSVDLELERQPDDVSVHAVRREGPIEVVVSKWAGSGEGMRRR